MLLTPSIVQAPPRSHHNRTVNTALLSWLSLNLQTCRLGNGGPLRFKRAAHFSTLSRAERLPGWLRFSRPGVDANRAPHSRPLRTIAVERTIQNTSPPVREGLRVNASHSKTDVLLVS